MAYIWVTLALLILHFTTFTCLHACVGRWMDRWIDKTTYIALVAYWSTDRWELRVSWTVKIAWMSRWMDKCMKRRIFQQTGLYLWRWGQPIRSTLSCQSFPFQPILLYTLSVRSSPFSFRTDWWMQTLETPSRTIKNPFMTEVPAATRQLTIRYKTQNQSRNCSALN